MSTQQKKRSLLLLGSIFMIIMLVSIPLLGETATSTMKPMTLKINHALNPAQSMDGKSVTWFGNEITKRTGGLIKCEHFYSGAMTKVGEELDAAGKGLVDVTHLVMAYYPSKLFLNSFNYAVPFASDDPLISQKVVNQLYAEIPEMSQEWEKFNVVVLSHRCLDSMDLLARMPIRSVDDFKGKKIAIAGVYAPRMISAIGATPISMAMGDTLTGLQTGVVDGRMVSRLVMYSFGLHQFAKYGTSTGLGAWYAVSIVINKDVFAKLPKDIQDTIRQVGKEEQENYMNQMVKERENTLKLMEQAGVTFSALSAADLAKWGQAMPDFPGEWVAEGEKRGITAAKKVMTQYLTLCEKAGHKFPVKWAAQYR
jgi:TRAP-type C4-dicarboxylate transport system substrate-binding protein